MPPSTPQPHLSAAEEQSDPDADADTFQIHPVSRSPAKPAAAASQLESDPEVPEPEPVPVPKKKPATNKSKPVAQDKKRAAPEPALSGKSKKAKTEAVNAAPEATPTGKGKKKKAKAEQEKATPGLTATGNAKKPGGKLEESALDPSQLTKSPVHRPWSKRDAMLILETLAKHVKSKAAKMPVRDLLTSVGARLDRKDCNYTDISEKVRTLKKRYLRIVNTGNVPSGGDELRMHNLSETIWGEEAIAASAAASQKDSVVTKSKKRQASKEKLDVNSKGGTEEEVTNQNIDTQKGSKKDQAVEVETDRNVKGKLLKEGTSTATQNGHALVTDKEASTGNQNGGTCAEEDTRENDAEDATATQNGNAFAHCNGGKMNKEASTGNQNGGTSTEEDTHEDDAERQTNVQGAHRRFEEMQNLYPNLAGCVERISAPHLCGGTIRMAFGFVGDEEAKALESKMKAQREIEMKTKIRRWGIQTDLLNQLLPLAD